MTIRPRRPKVALVLLLAGSLALSGCSSPSTSSAKSYPAATAQSLQSQVFAVSQTAANGDYAGSLTVLAELGVSAKDALSRGTISTERYASISAAIALVRSDLESAVAAEQQQQQQQQQQTTSPGSGPGPAPKPGKDGPGKGKKP
jgi:outer membrane lipoprotein SlyB